MLSDNRRTVTPPKLPISFPPTGQPTSTLDTALDNLIYQGPQNAVRKPLNDNEPEEERRTATEREKRAETSLLSVTLLAFDVHVPLRSTMVCGG